MNEPLPGLTDRITAYLSMGGLFNPEMANHKAVRDLLIECRDALSIDAPSHPNEPAYRPKQPANRDGSPFREAIAANIAASKDGTPLKQARLIVDEVWRVLSATQRSPQLQEPTAAMAGAWCNSLAKGSLLCHKNGHKGDAETLLDIAEFIRKLRQPNPAAAVAPEPVAHVVAAGGKVTLEWNQAASHGWFWQNGRHPLYAAPVAQPISDEQMAQATGGYVVDRAAYVVDRAA